MSFSCLRYVSLGCLALLLAIPAAAAPGRYLVVAPDQDTAAAQAAIRANGGTVIEAMDAIGIVVAEAEGDGFASAVAASPGVLTADADPDVEWLPEFEAGDDLLDLSLAAAGGDVAAAVVPNAETYSPLQWNLRQIHADATAAAGYLGAGARIAVIDSGVNTAHEDLVDRIDFANSKAYVRSKLEPVTGYAFEDDVGHGSAISCIVAASVNGRGVQGVAPQARIIAIKVTSGTPAPGFSNVGTFIRAIEYAIGLGVDAINLSQVKVFDRRNAGGNGGGEPLGHVLAAFTRAINHATASGVLVVMAAGNQGLDLNGRLFAAPAQLGNGVAVSATGPIGNQNFDRLASYSNYGASVITYAAPGGDDTLYPQVQPFWYALDLVPTCHRRDPLTGNPNTYYLVKGTSYAVPHVVGVAALLVGKYGHVGAARLNEIMTTSAVDVLPTAFQGRGRIDAEAALR